jgi:hypothetical protein
MADFDPRWGDAIAGIESGGESAPYTSVTANPNGKRALGKYQVMDFNVPQWTQAAIGKTLTPEQFLSDPDAQEAVFRHRFGSYVDKYGNPRDAASAWFTGGPLAYGADKSDMFGTTGNSYVAKFDRYMDGPTAIEKAMGNNKGGTSRMAYADDNGVLSTNATLGPGVLASPGVNRPAQQGGLENGLMGAAAALAGIANPDQAKALIAQQALGQKTAMEGSYSTSTLPDGTVLRINQKTGQVEKLPGNYAKDETADKWKATRIKANSDLSDEIDKNASASNTAMGQITSLKQLLSGKDAPYQGPGGEAYNKALSLASMIPGVDASKLANAQSAQAIMNEIALGMRNFAGGMPGSLSDKDLVFLRNMGPSLNNKPEANGKIMDMIAKVHNRNLDVQKQRDAYMKSHGQLDDDFRGQIASYAEGNRLFPDMPTSTPAPTPGATGSRPPLSDIFK